MKPNQTDLQIRRADADELDDVIACCGEALGWKPSGPNADFFRWKHRDNPFGASPIWVAVDKGDIVGVRTMMRWRLARGGQSLSMVRAVDTATLPSHQGRGIFTRLTLAAIDELTAEGVDAVFNTPNEKSRPGYLKMGWVDVGRVPVSVRVRSPMLLPRLWRSRVGAEKWGERLDLGRHGAEAPELASSWNPPVGWHTAVSEDYLAWRYRFDPLGYRVVDGSVIRVRTRGSTKELSVCEAFDDSPDIGRLLKDSVADVAIASGLRLRQGFVPASLLGPRLTWRPLGESQVPTMDELDLSLGTIELF